MPWFVDFLTALSRYRWRSPHLPGRRVLAAVLSVALALGTVSPAAALASEVDSEGEGTASPDAIEGGPGEAEETVLEEVAGSVTEGGSEDSSEGPPVESEPQVESEMPAVAPEEVSGSVGKVVPEAEAPAPEEPPATTESGPAYEPVPPPAAPVENQTLSAPSRAAGEPATEQQSSEFQTATSHSPSPPEPGPSEEEPPATQPVAVPAERLDSGGSLAGRDVHTVAPGECLWSIAAAMLPAGASNAEVAAEVRRLWNLNASRIGTGDPDLLMVGTKLVLG
jgi:hypothetical protein